MIPLIDIDHRAVLGTAHVSLCIAAPAPFARVEWIDGELFGLSSAPHSLNWHHLVPTMDTLRSVALDPWGPAVAALLDRRIAEACVAGDPRPESASLLAQPGGALAATFATRAAAWSAQQRPDWWIVFWRGPTRSYVRLSYGSDMAPALRALTGRDISVPAIEPAHQNLGVARGALIRALYPRKES